MVGPQNAESFSPNCNKTSLCNLIWSTHFLFSIFFLCHFIFMKHSVCVCILISWPGCPCLLYFFPTFFVTDFYGDTVCCWWSCLSLLLAFAGLLFSTCRHQALYPELWAVVKKIDKNGTKAFTEQRTVTVLRLYITKKVQIEQFCNSTRDFLRIF